jgi:GGDEF domain-containing protein
VSPGRILLRALFPGGLVVLAAVTLAYFGSGGDSATLIEGSVTLVIYGLGILLSLWFRRTRVAAAILLIALWDMVLPSFLGSQARGAMTLAAIVLGCSLGLLTILRDRGLRSFAGWFQLATPGLLLGFVILAGNYGAEGLERLASWVPGWLESAPDPASIAAQTGLTPAAWAGMGVGMLMALAGTIVHRGPVERGLPWALIAAALAMAVGLGSSTSTLLSLAAASLLAISVLELTHGFAFKDALTGLPSRRALQESLADVRRPYTLAMVDVDHFKRVNDRHGHDVGDQVLRMVASRLNRASGIGRAFRYGGEEFTLLIDGAERTEVKDQLESVRRAIEESEFKVRRKFRARGPGGKGARRRGTAGRRGAIPRRLSVTVSIGAADSSKAEDPESVLAAADKALYKAKRSGRNRVAV